MKSALSIKFIPWGLASWCGTPSVTPHIHRHNEVELYHVEKGAITYRFLNGSVTLSEGCLACFWGSIPHQCVRVEKSTLTHWLTLPLPWFIQSGLPPILTQQVLNGKIVVDPDFEERISCRKMFYRWHRDLKKNSDEQRKLVILEAETCLRHLSIFLQSTPAARRSSKSGRSFTVGTGGNKVEIMLRYIAEHYTEPIRIPQIAHRVGLHPDYAVNLFKKFCGINFVDYINYHRISHAQRLLITTHQKITDIALASGFGSLSRFYTVFEKICAQSPRQYRLAIN